LRGPQTRASLVRIPKARDRCSRCGNIHPRLMRASEKLLLIVDVVGVEGLSRMRIIEKMLRRKCSQIEIGFHPTTTMKLTRNLFFISACATSVKAFLLGPQHSKLVHAFAPPITSPPAHATTTARGFLSQFFSMFDTGKSAEKITKTELKELLYKLEKNWPEEVRPCRVGCSKPSGSVRDGSTVSQCHYFSTQFDSRRGL